MRTATTGGLTAETTGPGHTLDEPLETETLAPAGRGGRRAAVVAETASGSVTRTGDPQPRGRRGKGRPEHDAKLGLGARPALPAEGPTGGAPTSVGPHGKPHPTPESPPPLVAGALGTGVPTTAHEEPTEPYRGAAPRLGAAPKEVGEPRVPALPVKLPAPGTEPTPTGRSDAGSPLPAKVSGPTLSEQKNELATAGSQEALPPARPELRAPAETLAPKAAAPPPEPIPPQQDAQGWDPVELRAPSAGAGGAHPDEATARGGDGGPVRSNEAAEPRPGETPADQDPAMPAGAAAAASSVPPPSGEAPLGPPVPPPVDAAKGAGEVQSRPPLAPPPSIPVPPTLPPLGEERSTHSDSTARAESSTSSRLTEEPTDLEHRARLSPRPQWVATGEALPWLPALIDLTTVLPGRWSTPGDGPDSTSRESIDELESLEVHGVADLDSGSAGPRAVSPDVADDLVAARGEFRTEVSLADLDDLLLSDPEPLHDPFPGPDPSPARSAWVDPRVEPTPSPPARQAAGLGSGAESPAPTPPEPTLATSRPPEPSPAPPTSSAVGEPLPPAQSGARWTPPSETASPGALPLADPATLSAPEDGPLPEAAPELQEEPSGPWARDEIEEQSRPLSPSFHALASAWPEGPGSVEGEGPLSEELDDLLLEPEENTDVGDAYRFAGPWVLVLGGPGRGGLDAGGRSLRLVGPGLPAAVAGDSAVQIDLGLGGPLPVSRDQALSGAAAPAPAPPRRTAPARGGEELRPVDLRALPATQDRSGPAPPGQASTETTAGRGTDPVVPAPPSGEGAAEDWLDGE